MQFGLSHAGNVPVSAVKHIKATTNYTCVSTVLQLDLKRIRYKPLLSEDSPGLKPATSLTNLV